MSYELKTNTAVRIAVGPLVDPTDGKTAETALTVTALSVQLYKIANDGGAVVRVQFTPTASGGTNDMVLVTSSTDGMYDLELTAAQLNWLGNGRISFYDVDGFLVHYFDIHVVSANYWDNKYGATIEQVDVRQLLGTAWLEPGTAGTPDVNAKQIGATVQTGRDIGANVLLSSGTGTGQLDFTSGVVKSNLSQILGTALTETTGYLAAGFKKLFNVATPLLVASDAMRGTDGANTVVPDAAGVAPTAAEIKTAIEADGSSLAQILTDTGTTLDTLIKDIPTNTELDAALASALDAAFTDATGLTANGLKDRIRTIMWILRNKMSVTDANGNTVILKDDNSTEAINVNSALTDNSTTTIRLRLA